MASAANPWQLHIKDAAKLGPVPPIRELIRLSNSLAALARTQGGDTLIPPEVLHELCKVAEDSRGTSPCQTVCNGVANCRQVCEDVEERSSKGKTSGAAAEGGASDGLCVDVAFEWGDGTHTLNPCNFTWEVRQLEPALAMCVSSAFLTDNPIDTSDVKHFSHEEVSVGQTIYDCQPDPTVPLPRGVSSRIFCRQKTKPPPPPPAYIPPENMEAAAEAAALEAARQGAAAVFERNTLVYTLSTVQSWWKAYTSVPPYNRTDTTRRKILGYFHAESCAACGMCGLHLRLDSRNFQGFQTRSMLPKFIVVGELWWARLLPVEGDWRLDPFEARYTQFALTFSVTISAGTPAEADFARSNLQVCVLTNSSYLREEAASQAAAAAGNVPDEEKLLREFAGPPKFWSLNTSTGKPPAFCHAHELERGPVGRQASAGTARFSSEIRGTVSLLQPSAGGWFLLLKIGELGKTPLAAARQGSRFSLTASLQLHTREHSCSDKVGDWGGAGKREVEPEILLTEIWMVCCQRKRVRV